MEIQTKYNVGDYVEIEAWRTHYEKCPICEGKGKISVKDKKFNCPECHGEKKVKTTTKDKTIRRITDIRISFTSRGIPIVRYVSDLSGWAHNDCETFGESDILREVPKNT